MSVWGGIGEGIAQGLSDRMAREDQMRRERQAQANADRAFQFQKEQAQRTQANADRQYEANRADAANTQANAERQMAQGERRLDLYQQNADREYGLKQDELALKGEAQEWDSALKDEQLRGFQMANEKLDIELRKKKREEEIQQNTGADQFVLATSRMLDGTLGNRGKWQFGTDDGKRQDLEGTLVEGDGFYQIFGKDSPLVKQGFYGIFMQDDENGEPNFVFLNSNPQANIVKTPEQMYEMYKGQYNESLANRYFGKTAQRKDLGMLREQENIKADAKMRVQIASDPTGFKQMTQLFQSIRAGVADGSIQLDADATEKLNSLAPVIIDAISQRFGKKTPAPVKTGEWAGFSPEKRAYLEQKGFVWDAEQGEPVKKQPNPKARLVVPAK